MNATRRFATTTATLAIMAVLAAGCSGGPTASESPTATTTSAGQPPAEGGTGACPNVPESELASFGLGVQLLAQLRSQAQVDSVVEGGLPYDPDAFAAVLDQLEPLRGYDTGGLGSPGEAIDFLRGVNQIGGRMLAADGEVPQELFDEMAAYAGEPVDVIAKQLPINVALGDLCE